MENYTVVIYARFLLAPLSCEGKTQSNKAKADDHIPGTDMWDWILGSADVINDDPDQAKDEGADHGWCQPLRALSWNWSVVSNGLRNERLFLLT